MTFFADKRAYLYFLAITIILNDYAIDHAISKNSSLISPITLKLFMSDVINKILHTVTINISSLFHIMFWFKNLKNPYIRTLNEKSVVTTIFMSNSIQINVVDLAILNPSTIVIIINKRHAQNTPI